MSVLSSSLIEKLSTNAVRLISIQALINWKIKMNNLQFSKYILPLKVTVMFPSGGTSIKGVPFT